MKAVNLIPTEQRRVRATGSSSGSAYVLIGVLATLLVMVAAYVFTSSNVDGPPEQGRRRQGGGRPARGPGGAEQSFTNFAQIKQTRLASVSTIAGTRFDWERMMRELARAMPGGSWLQAADAPWPAGPRRRHGRRLDHDGGARRTERHPHGLHPEPGRCGQDDGAPAAAAPRHRRGPEPVEHRGAAASRARSPRTAAAPTTRST